jgi:hypothetical protein
MSLDDWTDHLVLRNLDFQKGATFHTAIKPFKRSDYLASMRKDSLVAVHEKSVDRSKFFGKVWHRIARDHLLKVDVEGLKLTINPLFDFQSMQMLEPSGTGFINSRGFQIEGTIGKKVSFSSQFWENQAKFPSFVDRLIRDSLQVVPGMGRVRKFKNAGAFDYASSQAYVSWELSDHFNLQFGHGKNFFGDGYRSMLLSDASFNYPFLKLTTDVWKIKYVNLWTEFQGVGDRSFALGFDRKYGSFHYLSWAVTKRFQMGLFEGIIWQQRDSIGNRGFDINYLNPVIFMRPVEFALGSPDNAVIGLNLKYLLEDNIHVYGQLMIDDMKFSELKKGNGFFGQKLAWQLGYKYFDFLNIRGLYLHAEYNVAQPYTYAHKVPEQAYTHYNQPLAHPLGANFKEGVIVFGYTKNRWLIKARLTGADVGLDSAGNHRGQDIFRSDYLIPGYPNSTGNRVTQGKLTNIQGVGLSAGYVINPRTNMMLTASYTLRTISSNSVQVTDSFINFGVRTSIRDLVFDF